MVVLVVLVVLGGRVRSRFVRLELFGKAHVWMHPGPQHLQVFQRLAIAHALCFYQVANHNAGRAGLAIVTMDEHAAFALTYGVNVGEALLKVLLDVCGRAVWDADPLVGELGRVGTIHLFCHV